MHPVTERLIAELRGASLNGAQLRRLSARYFREIRKLPKGEIFALCEELLDAGQMTVPFDWAFRCRRHYEKKDFKILASWVERYVDDWWKCNDLCVHPLGYFIYVFPEFAPRLRKWTRSADLWKRRVAAVALIYSLRRGNLLAECLEMADLLLLDREVMVQKGYGWMLKEASNRTRGIRFRDGEHDGDVQNCSEIRCGEPAT